MMSILGTRVKDSNLELINCIRFYQFGYELLNILLISNSSIKKSIKKYNVANEATDEYLNSSLQKGIVILSSYVVHDVCVCANNTTRSY